MTTPTQRDRHYHFMRGIRCAKDALQRHLGIVALAASGDREDKHLDAIKKQTQFLVGVLRDLEKNGGRS